VEPQRVLARHDAARAAAYPELGAVDVALDLHAGDPREQALALELGGLTARGRDLLAALLQILGEEPDRVDVVVTLDLRLRQVVEHAVVRDELVGAGELGQRAVVVSLFVELDPALKVALRPLHASAGVERGARGLGARTRWRARRLRRRGAGEVRESEREQQRARSVHERTDLLSTRDRRRASPRPARTARAARPRADRAASN